MGAQDDGRTEPDLSPAGAEHARWGATVAELVAALLFIPMPEGISPGPGWLPAGATILLLLPLTLMQEATRRPGGLEFSPRLLRILALALLSVLALAEAISLGTLLHALPEIKQGSLLFRSAGLIWVINVLVFGLSYWEMDGGGPARRARINYQPDDFLFPQQTNEKLNKGWSPEYLDYLFLAFNTATAFSPTDTMILSRPAKALMIVQSSIALLTVALVVGRGVNIL